MKIRLCTLPIGLLGLSLTAGLAQTNQLNQVRTNDLREVRLETPAQAEKLNRVGLSYRMGLNMTVDFKKFGGLALSDPGPATGSTYNRNYDDGYNRLDSSGNANGQTWYWGYNNASSVQGDTLVLHSYSTPPNASSKNREEDPQHGLEATYSRELRREEKYRLGVEGALGYTLFSVSESRNLQAGVYRTNDVFALGGVVPPLPPYRGTFSGPGPVIDSSLVAGDRTITYLPNAATVAGHRELDADIFTIRLGPYIEVPIYKKLAATFNGGLTLAIGAAEFRYKETVTINDPAYNIHLVSSQRSGSASQLDVLVGGYVGGNLSYEVIEDLRVFAGAIFQAAGESVTKKNGKEAVLDMGESIIVSVGFNYAF